MADQRININLGTRYDGGGLGAASRGLNKFAATAGRAGGEMQKFSSSIGVLGGVLGQMPGKFGAVMSGFSGLLGMIASGPGAIAGVAVALGALAVKGVQWLADSTNEAKKAMELEQQVHDRRMKHLDETTAAIDRQASAQQRAFASEQKMLKSDLSSTDSLTKMKLQLAAAKAKASGDVQAERKAAEDLAAFEATAQQAQLEREKQAAQRQLKINEDAAKKQSEIAKQYADEQARIKAKMSRITGEARAGVQREYTYMTPFGAAGAQYHTYRRTDEQLARERDAAEAAAKNTEEYKKLQEELAKTEPKYADAQLRLEQFTRSVAEAQAALDASSLAVEAGIAQAEMLTVQRDASWAAEDKARAEAEAKRRQAEEEAAEKRLQQEKADAVFSRKQLDDIRKAAQKPVQANVVVQAADGVQTPRPSADAARSVFDIGRAADPTGFKYRTTAGGAAALPQDWSRARRYAERQARAEAAGQIGSGEWNRREAEAIRTQRDINAGRDVSRSRLKAMQDWEAYKQQLQNAQNDPAVKALGDIKTLLEQSLNIN